MLDNCESSPGACILKIKFPLLSNNYDLHPFGLDHGIRFPLKDRFLDERIFIRRKVIIIFFLVLMLFIVIPYNKKLGNFICIWLFWLIFYCYSI